MLFCFIDEKFSEYNNCMKRNHIKTPNLNLDIISFFSDDKMPQGLKTFQIASALNLQKFMGSNETAVFII